MSQLAGDTNSAETLSATELGFLRGGSWAAVTAGLAMLHVRGVVEPGAGRIRRTALPPRDAEPLERALYAALYASLGPRELASQKRVRRELRNLRRNLIEQGLVRSASRRLLIPPLLVALPPAILPQVVAHTAIGVTEGLVAVAVLVGVAVWLLPRRTIAGDRALAARIRHDKLVEPFQLEPAEVGVAVALCGTAALQTLMPKFARDSGLLDGGRWSNNLDSRLDSSPWAPNTDLFWN